MEWMIYGDLDFMADILNGIALLTAGVGGAGGDFSGLLELALLIGALSTIVTGVATAGRINWIPLFGTFLVFMALLAPTRTVTMESVYTGQTRTVVPVRLAGLIFFSLDWGTPRRTSWNHRLPSRTTSISRRSDTAFTTDTPTPCNPPDT